MYKLYASHYTLNELKKKYGISFKSFKYATSKS